ncbi:DUF6458 family protein [Actinomadura kijaniata]|uniref:DUF6458 family protein n=1 Tax=Actinomadura kijaniata TaxID=46161 RepID=UPI000A00651A|nr:DUF6458 family protein [Actinomadura kijaniata]
MGIGVSLAFIAIGAILAFALQIDLSGINITMVGWILILVGLISMAFTLLYTRPRRRASLMAGADPGYVDPASPEAAGTETVVEERIIEERPAGPVVERVIERPVAPPARGHTSQDPARAQDPAIAQDPAAQNIPSSTLADPASRTRRRPPHERG